MRRRHFRAQALVEFALILPIMLLLILGGLQMGVMMVTRIQLVHAAQEGAVAGARTAAVPQRCPTAVDTAQAIYGRSVEAKCSQPGNVVELTLTDGVPLISPFFSGFTVEVTGRSAVR